VLKPKWNEQGPRRYQPGGYYRSFANYRPPSFEVDTKNFAAIRSGDPVISRFWDCQKKSLRLWRVFEEAKIFTIAQKDLKDGLKKTSYAISVDETRYVLN
jgi:hypothetical protein